MSAISVATAPRIVGKRLTYDTEGRENHRLKCGRIVLSMAKVGAGILKMASPN